MLVLFLLFIAVLVLFIFCNGLENEIKNLSLSGLKLLLHDSTSIQQIFQKDKKEK